MSKHFPDNWSVLHITVGSTPHYRVIGGWSGGYATGDSWRMNSGIVSVKETDTHFIFYGSSGSEYHCHKNSCTIRMNTANIIEHYIKQHPDGVTVMPEDTDWMNMDWLIS